MDQELLSFCEFVARKHRAVKLLADHLKWNEWLRPTITKSMMSDRAKKADVYDWLENVAYAIEGALKAYLLLKHGPNHPHIIPTKCIEQNGEGADTKSTRGTHRLKEIFDCVEAKDDRLVSDLCLTVDLKTNTTLRCLIEKFSRLKDMVQYNGENFPCDVEDDEFCSMVHAFYVLTLYLGNLIESILEEQNVSDRESLLGWLGYDFRSPRVDQPQGGTFIHLDMSDEDRGVNIHPDWDIIENMDFDQDNLKFTLRMDWIYGDMPRKTKLIVLFDDEDASKCYNDLPSLRSQKQIDGISFYRCVPVERDVENNEFVVRCASVGSRWGGRNINLSLDTVDIYTPSRDRDGQYTEMVKLKELDHYKSQFSKGMTDLHLVSERDFDHVAEDLVRSGADINALYGDDITPLLWAAWFNSYRVALILLEAGADIKRKYQDSKTVLHWAAKANNPDLSGPSVTRVLLDPKWEIDVLAKTASGLTMIHLAAFSDSHFGSLCLFLEWFADNKKFGIDGVDAQDELGRTALHIACKAGAKKCIERLIDRDAKQSIKNNLGQLPLDTVNRPVDPDIWKMLDGR